MHRLFVALRPPTGVRAALLALMNGIKGARWQDDDQLHITLRFVGEVNRHQANDLADALGEIRFSPFQIALAGAGCFERKAMSTRCGPAWSRGGPWRNFTGRWTVPASRPAFPRTIAAISPMSRSPALGERQAPWTPSWRFMPAFPAPHSP